MSNRRHLYRPLAFVALLITPLALLLATAGAAVGQTGNYTLTSLGIPPNADTVAGVRMNNFGEVAGFSIYYGQGEPSIRPWIWTPEEGFAVLPPPPDMFEGRARAMDISDTGIVAGDGGFDAGIAWRYENGEYETFGQVGGMFIAYLGGVNDAGDVAGTSKDASIITEDEIFLDINGEGTLFLTPGDEGGRASDVNNALQVCGYSQGPLSGFEAYRWDPENGFQFLGALDLAYSFAGGINEAGQVVGSASSLTGNTSKAWIYSDELGMQQIPAPVTESTGAAAINNYGHVVGTSHGAPDLPWLWTGGSGVTNLNALFDFDAYDILLTAAHDINDAGQILASGYDSAAGGWRTVILTPDNLGTGACCLAGDSCLADVTADDCAQQAGTYQGDASGCDSCVPLGACCQTDGNCEDFLSLDDCNGIVGSWQGPDSSCATLTCPVGVVNDNCADALPIALGDTPFSTLGASTDGPQLPQSCAEPAGTYFGMDIWYLYEPDGDGILTVSTCNQADYDTRLAAYTGGCANLQIAGCNDDVTPPTCYYGTSIMDVPVTCGEPVLIRVGSFSVYMGTGTMTLTFEGDPCEAVAGDCNGDGIVDIADLLAVIGEWGSCEGCAEDLDNNGAVDVNDLLIVLGNWG